MKAWFKKLLCRHCEDLKEKYDAITKDYKSLQVRAKEAEDMAKKEIKISIDLLVELDSLKKLSIVRWIPLSDEIPPTHVNILVANKDFTFMGFLYYEDGWDQSRKINMQGKNVVLATYTNPDSITWWLNLDLIKREINSER